jgi:hypothetical protein
MSSTIPDVLTNIPPLSSITKAKPSPLLQNNLVNIVYAYAFTDLLYNGEMDSSPFECVEVVMAVSPVLSKGTVYDSIEVSVQRSIESSLQVIIINVAFTNILHSQCCLLQWHIQYQ